MRIEWHNSQNGRHYVVYLFEDLLGDWVLLRRWYGSVRRGNHKIVCVKNYADGIIQINTISLKRTRHGYHKI